MTDSISSRQLQAVRWILKGQEEGIYRSQQSAADKFGIRQSVVSLGMKKYVAKDKIPDGRRREHVANRPHRRDANK